MELIAALGFAFGATYALAMPLRTVRYPKLFWSTFAIAYLTTVAAFYLLAMPYRVQALLGATGFVIGCGLALLRKKTKRLEEEYENSRRARGEKVIP